MNENPDVKCVDAATKRRSAAKRKWRSCALIVVHARAWVQPSSNLTRKVPSCRTNDATRALCRNCPVNSRIGRLRLCPRPFPARTISASCARLQEPKSRAAIGLPLGTVSLKYFKHDLRLVRLGDFPKAQTCGQRWPPARTC